MPAQKGAEEDGGGSLGQASKRCRFFWLLGRAEREGGREGWMEGADWNAARGGGRRSLSARSRRRRDISAKCVAREEEEGVSNEYEEGAFRAKGIERRKGGDVFTEGQFPPSPLSLVRPKICLPFAARKSRKFCNQSSILLFLFTAFLSVKEMLSDTPKTPPPFPSLPFPFLPKVLYPGCPRKEPTSD